MERRQIVCKEEMHLKFECNDIKEVLIKPLESQENGVHKMCEYPSNIENWSSLPWICCHCTNIFNGYRILKIHLGELHEETNGIQEHYQCIDCNDLLASYSSFISHVRTAHHETLKLCCDVCNQIFPDYVHLSIHRDNHNEELSNNYPAVYHCSLCENAFSSEKELKKHIQLPHNSMHSEETKTLYSDEIECVENSIQCKEEYNEAEPIYQCGKCVKSFANEIGLKDHIKCHDKSAKHICQLCSKVYKYNSQLEEHMRSHTGDHPFQCKICPKRYSIKSRLTVHMLIHTDKFPHKCDVCEKSYRRRTNLLEHMRLHTGELPFKCDYCEQRFRIKARKTSHMFTHTGERPFKCDICVKTFINKQHLTYHIRCHSGERPFKCELCEKCFKTNQEKKHHIRSLHTDVCPYFCEICSKSFKTISNKKSHMPVHSDERPFPCELCDKCFKSKKAKKRHTKICKGPTEANALEDTKDIYIN